MWGFIKRLAARVQDTTVEDVTEAAKKVQQWVADKWAVVTAIVATATGVKMAVLAWVLGAGWPYVERVIAVTGPEFVAGVVAAGVLVGSAFTVTAAGLVKAACR